jgi:hypothetical protein
VTKRNGIPKTVRDKVLVDAMHRCCLCPEHQEVVDLHHVVPISEDGPNTEDNLMAVCPTCHAKIHRIRNRYSAEQLRMYKERWVQLCALGLPLDMRIAQAFDTTRPPTPTQTPAVSLVSHGPSTSAGSIPADIFNQMRKALLDCDSFGDDRQLNAVFAHPKLKPWQHSMPQASNPAARVDAVIAFLVDKRRADTGESALVLLLCALSERLDPADELHSRLVELTASLDQIVFAAPNPLSTATSRLPQLALKLFRMDRKQAHQDQIVFSPSKEERTIERVFGLALENTTETIPAKGIFIRVEFWWRGESPQKPPIIYAPSQHEKWTPPFSELLNEKEAVLNFRDPDLACVHKHPVEWGNFKFVLSEPIKGSFLITYTISTLEPVTESHGELRIVIGDDAQGS